MKNLRIHPEDNLFQRFLLIGGFLGAGKTTLIGELTRKLEGEDRKVALITNDQGEGLMDTASARRATGGQKNVAEITGGCFCCRLDELVNSIKALDNTSRPDVMIAEPVGSCTDLMATVLKPLERIYHTPMVLAPLSVVLDARRALAALGGRRHLGSLHRDVGYVYRKQLEEAEWLVVNKIDLLTEADHDDLKRRLTSEFPAKRQFHLSARTGEGLDQWFRSLLSHRSAPGEPIEIDYDRYAEGEALLGWVNLRGEVSRLTAPGAWLLNLARTIANSLADCGYEVGHFKMSLENGPARWRIHQVVSGEPIELVEEVPESLSPLAPLRLLVNLRAEGSAENLQEMIIRALAQQDDATVDFDQQEAFQPGRPEPTHRIA